MHFEYDGCPFQKVDGKWICKAWAMRGPTGQMMDKEVPEPYQSQIETAYRKQDSILDLPEKVIEPPVEIIESIPVSDPIEQKLNNLKEKVRKGKIQAKVKKTNLAGKINPFQ